MEIQSLKNWIRSRKNSPARDVNLESAANYWTDRNVTHHHKFQSREESLDYFEWRCLQYLNLLELMPVKGLDGLKVLDYGCGPGHDCVGITEFSRPARMVGADVSAVSLSEAAHRLSLHGDKGAKVELVRLVPGEPLPFADGEFDYVHSSGVLHHVPNLSFVLGEIQRVLRPGGEFRSMVYNRDSIWFHLYVPYQLQILEGKFSDCSVEEAFRRSTDGIDCPVSNCYRPKEFVSILSSAGFQRAEFLGAALDAWELKHVPKRADALLDRRLPSVHRQFLYDLGMDAKGLPTYEGHCAGVDAVFRCFKEPRMPA